MIREALGFVLAAALFGAGCMRPPGPAEKVSDAARDLNVSTRFGEVHGVLGMTSPAVQKEFLGRRAEWGKLVRVVDVELAGLTLADQHRASVLVDFSWTRTDQGTLRTTRVLQEWRDEDSGWRLVRERRISGDLGLFGEAMPAESPEPRPDVQFETRVIR